MHPFEIMAEPVRRRIVEILASGEHSAGDIAEAVGREFGITQPSVAHHLRILRECEWVEVRTEWVNRMYQLNDEALDWIEAEVHTLRQLWDRRIGTVHRHDPQPWHAKPIERLPPKRSKRGFRGAGVKDDPWVRGVPEP